MDDNSDDEICESGDVRASKLGKQAYWDKVYTEELLNFEERGDEGEVWFGADTLDRVVEWSADVIRQHFGEDAEGAQILDVGTGNGTMLVGLAAQGFSQLSGNDYSLPSLKLARRVLDRHGLQHVLLQEVDLTDVEAACASGDSFSIITDKGTLDAIGLSGRPDARAAYQESVWSRLKEGGLLIVTSCNSTREELLDEFCSPTRSLKVWTEVDHIKTHPKFRFGGLEGSKVATVAFQKRKT